MFAYILGCVFILTALWILALATGWGLPYILLTQGLEWLRANPWQSTIIAAVLLFMGLLLFVLIRPKESGEKSFKTSIKGANIQISQEALQEIITRSAMTLQGIIQIKTSMRERDGGLLITLSCQFEQGEIIPRISEELQTKVKEDVEMYTGIRVAEVKVLVMRLEKTHLSRKK